MASILVADDQLVMRNMFKNILCMDGYDVDLVDDGKQAFLAATKKRYDLILTDLYMPECNGIELTRRLRKLSTYKGVPILVVSTESAVGKIEEGKKAGATGWVVKPVNDEKLLPILRKLLS
ncbi:MAG: response regulator [Pseudomonadales bacterium]|nr:response regulator [Pseudomonadales bacterium]